ncbi:MAG: cell envelope integrity protein TolA [Devosiaceae bacterium]
MLLHAALFGGMVINISEPDPFDVVTAQAVPVDILSPEEFSQITRGSRTAEPLPTPEAPPSAGPSDVDRGTDTGGEGRQDAATAADNALATPDSAAPPPPPPPPEPEPEPEPVEPEPEPAPAPPEPEVAEPAPAEEPTPEPEPTQTARVAAPAPIARPDIAPQPVQRPEPVQQPQDEQFNADEIAALINRDENQGGGGANDTAPATRGAPEGRDQRLSESEMDALRRQIARCWNPPVGAVGASDLVVRVQLNLAETGALNGAARVINSSGNPAFQAAADSAVRAVRRCAPYSLPFEKYSAWQDVIVNFDPRDMVR